MRSAVALLFLLSFQAFARDPILEPMGEADFGRSVSQTANVFQITPADIAWMDGDYVREAYPYLAEGTDEQLRNFFVGQPIAHQTVLQSAWEGILMKTMAEPVGQFTVTHPPFYIRGDFFTMWVENIFGPQQIGSLDGKGTGLSPDGEHMMRVYERPLALIMGRNPLPDNWEKHPLALAMFSDLNSHIENLREGKAILQERVQRAKTAEIQRSWEHSLKHRAELPLQFSLQLRASLQKVVKKQTVPPSELDALLKLIRALDYTSGLLPLERGIKEAKMGVAHHLIWEKYNAAHGTNFGIVRPIMVVKLPVKIILPSGELTDACILYRKPHWRAHSKVTQFKDAMPVDVVSGVLDGGMQFDIFGRMVDLELPELKLPPLSKITGYVASIGHHPIESRAASAAKQYAAGNMAAIPALEAEIRRLAAEVVIPPVPSHKPSKTMDLDRQFLDAVKLIRDHSKGKTEALLAALRPLVISDKVIDERKELLLIKLIAIDMEAGTKLLMETIDHYSDRAVEAAGRTRRVRTIKSDFLAGPIRNVLLSIDPSQLLGDSTAARAFAKDFRQRHPLFFKHMLYLCRDILRKVFEMMQAPAGGMYRGHPHYEMAEMSVEALLSMQAVLETSGRGKAIELWDQMQFSNGETSLSAKEYLNQMSKSSSFYLALVLTAETMAGGFLDETLLRYLDPEDEAKVIAAHEAMRAELERLRPQVEQLKQAHAMAAGCGGQVIMAGNQPLVIIGGGAGRLNQLVEMMTGRPSGQDGEEPKDKE